MAFNHLMLPQYQVANGFDVSPISNALQSNQDNLLAQNRLGLQRRQVDLAERADTRAGETHGLQMAQMRRQSEQEEARMVAGRIQYIQGLPPEQRMAAWETARQQPGFRDLPAEFDDFNYAAPQLLGKANEYLGPKEKAQIGLIEAQTQKARREASEAGGYGKDVKLFQDEFGRTWGVQAGSRGDLKFHNLSSPGSPPTTQPPPGFPTGGGQAAPSVAPQAPPGGPPQTQRPSLTPFRPRSVVGDRVFNPATGQFEGSAADAIAGGERAKGEGQHIAKLVETLPKSRATLEAANAKVDIVRGKIAQALPMVSQWTTGYGAVLSNWPATAARDFKGQIDTIVANLGFDELQEMRQNSPTGGALGQVAVQELDMLQKTKASLDQAQSPQQVIRALQELDRFYAEAVPRRQRAFEETYAPLAQRRSGGQAQPQGGQDMPRPSSPEEAARLPRGTRFMAPDGSIRTVP
jgi:hypothetical protein